MNEKLQLEFNEWVIDVLHDLPENVAAFNFNIYEEESEYLTEIVATSSFSEEDDTWATEEIWNSGELMFIIPIELFDGSWEDFHDLIADLVDNLLDSNLPCASILKHGAAVSVGFIDSELELLWKNH